MHIGLGWLGAAVLLAAGEAVGGELVLLMLAGGALGGPAAAFLGAPLWGRALARRRLVSALPGNDTNTAALAGRDGTVVEAVGSGGGLVELGGDTWTARPLLEGETFEAGEKSLVHEIQGATAIGVRGV